MYVIGDVHGCNKSLQALLSLLPLTQGDEILFLGDLVGRGPSSKGVIDTILTLETHYSVTSLMGNHDSRFLDALGWNSLETFGDDRLSDGQFHLELGGKETLLSYGVTEPSQHSTLTLPANHVRFFATMKLYHTTSDYLFIHGGLTEEALKQPSVEEALHIDLQQPRSLLWERNTQEVSHNLGVTIIHGHINHAELVMERAGKINLDTGCVWGRRLTAMKLPERFCYSVPCLDTLTYTS